MTVVLKTLLSPLHILGQWHRDRCCTERGTSFIRGCVCVRECVHRDQARKGPIARQRAGYTGPLEDFDLAAYDQQAAETLSYEVRVRVCVCVCVCVCRVACVMGQSTIAAVFIVHSAS